MVFYDRTGQPVASKDAASDVIYAWSGKPVAILDDESLFGFDGRHVGWFMDGWVRDHHGDCMYFTDGAIGGPARPPTVAPKRAQGAREAPPAHEPMHRRPLRPARTLVWSNVAIFDA